MKKMFLTLLLSAAATVLFAQTLSVGTVRKQAEAYLREEGYAPATDDDGDLYFKVQGISYFLSLKAMDDGSVLGEFYALFSTETPYAKILEGCNAENCNRSVIKYCAYLVDGSKTRYTIGYEFFCNPGTPIRSFLKDAISLLPSLVQEFHNTYEQ